jgi:hypothetical protein
MRDSAVCKRLDALRLPRPRRSIVMPMLLRRIAGVALVAGTSASDARVAPMGA